MIQPDGYVERHTDTVRSVLDGSDSTSCVAWALFTLMSQKLGRDEDMWHGVTRCTDAIRASGNKRSADSALYGCVLVAMCVRGGGFQYEPFMRAARTVALNESDGESSMYDRVVWCCFLYFMASVLEKSQPACGAYYRRLADATWPTEEETSNDCLVWIVLAHMHRPSRPRWWWRTIVCQRLSASMSAAARFGLVYCALHLAQDHRIISRMDNIAPVHTDPEATMWFALEEAALLMRRSDFSPFCIAADDLKLSHQPRGLPFLLVLSCTVAVVVVAVAMVLMWRRLKR